MPQTKWENLLIKIKDSKTGEEGWLRADKLIEAIGESMIESGFLDNNKV